MGFIYNISKLKNLRRSLRRSQTDAERKIWSHLRNYRFYNLKFFHQYSVAQYILDFFCPELKLAIEIDGGQYAEIKNKIHDHRRTKYLQDKNIKMIRFWNNEVLGNNIEGVLEKVAEIAELNNPSQPPLSLRGGERSNAIRLRAEKKFKFLFFLFFLLLPINAVSAVGDSDSDGLSDHEEINVYFTDVNNQDTDGDGFTDGEEILNHYSPHQADKSLSQTDYDGDGLSDWQELQFGTSLNKLDTDGDGYSDWEEVINSFHPLNKEVVKLPQKIIINTAQQTLTATLNDIPLATWPISTGQVGYETPAGEYEINNKHPRAWSKPYGLWMPYWMSFIGSQYGIHELPEWPGGVKEGANHLGTAVSHGCVRLGVGPAQWLYNWANIGTKVLVIN